MAKLTAAQRKKLPANAFAIPSQRAYPIHDREHAADALARAAGKPVASKVRSAVYKKYPSMKKGSKSSATKRKK